MTIPADGKQGGQLKCSCRRSFGVVPRARPPTSTCPPKNPPRERRYAPWPDTSSNPPSATPPRRQRRRQAAPPTRRTTGEQEKEPRQETQVSAHGRRQTAATQAG